MAKKYEVLDKVNVGGEILKEKFKVLVNELELFHLYHFEV